MKNTNFSMIAGYEGEKQNLQTICEMLKKMTALKEKNIRPPRGILLAGKSGVGKTILAESMITESGISCVRIDGSCIDSELDIARFIDIKFKEAAERQPSIVFIDELDKIAFETYMFEDTRISKAARALLNAVDRHYEDMITVVATANEVDIIPSMLTRSGRFDRIIEIPSPNALDRRAIVKYYAGVLDFPGDIDLDTVASIMEGYTGADIESVLNEAALEAIVNGSGEVTMENITSAADRLTFSGVVRKVSMTEAERRIIAIHEVGHLVVSLVTDKENVSGASILPQGKTMGHVKRSRDKVTLNSVRIIKKNITSLLAGKANEELYLPNECYFGAEHDIEVAYNLANKIVSSGCMNIEFFCSGRDSCGYGGNASKSSDIEKTVLDMITEAAEEARTILRAYERLSDIFIEALLEKSVLSREEIMELYNAYQRGEGTLVQ